MPLVCFAEDMMESEVVVRLLKQPQPPGRAVPDVVHISAGTLPGDTWHVSQYCGSCVATQENSYVPFSPVPFSPVNAGTDSGGTGRTALHPIQLAASLLCGDA